MQAPWKHYLSELVGTALLIALGLSAVIFDFGAGSPLVTWVPAAGTRRLLTGFVFGTIGALIAVSRVGKVSGAHINPAVTLAFLWMGKLRARHAIGYVLAQVAGAILGAVPLLLWGPIGRSAAFGATLPGAGYGPGTALLGELATTFALVIGLFAFIRHPAIRAYTPLLFPFLYAVMVYLEAPVSGTSTNPARSLGPALLAMDWRAWWVYWLGPAAGATAAVLAYKATPLRRLDVEVAKLYHFEHDPSGLLHGGPSGGAARRRGTRASDRR